LLVALTCLTLTAAATACPCPADVDGSGTVDVDDLLIVLTEWGPCNGCAGDVNDDDVVDFVDLLDVLTAWGPCNFDYEPLQDDAEAEQIGLEMLGAEGPLRMPDDTYDRIDRDLELIRIAEPTLASENCTICGYDDAIHSPAWAATKLLVRKVPKAPPDDYEAFNACFDVVREDHLFGDVYVLHFPHALNAPGARPACGHRRPLQLLGPDVVGRWRLAVGHRRRVLRLPRRLLLPPLLRLRGGRRRRGRADLVRVFSRRLLRAVPAVIPLSFQLERGVPDPHG
jgi:hypothetical protein